MLARVLPLRRMGVLDRGPLPPSTEWSVGILEFVKASADAPRRLVVRLPRSAPDRGVIFELIRPELVDVGGQRLRVRGIEAVQLGGDVRGAMVQEWLVEIST